MIRKRRVWEPIFPSTPVKGKDHNGIDIICPLFIKDIAKAIVSAGKSLQLMQHVLVESAVTLNKGDEYEIHVPDPPKHHFFVSQLAAHIRCPMGIHDHCFGNELAAHGREMHHVQNMGGLTLSEVFCLSLAGLIGDRSHIFKYFKNDYPWTLEISEICESYIDTQNGAKEKSKTVPSSTASEKVWCNFLLDTMLQKNGQMGIERENNLKHVSKALDYSNEKNEVKEVADFDTQKCKEANTDDMDESSLVRSFWPENPAFTVCREIFSEEYCSILNLSPSFCLPPLNDENLREAFFGGNHANNGNEMNVAKECLLHARAQTMPLVLCLENMNILD